MALLRFRDFYPNYRDMSTDMGFDMDDITNYSVYSQDGDKVGSIDDVLVDDREGRLRYFVVDTGPWIFGKKVLMPIGYGRLDSSDKRVYANTLTKEQVEHLPTMDDLDRVDYDYEEQVRNVYRPSVATGTAATSATASRTAAQPAAYDRNNYSYDRDPHLYNMRDQDHQSLKLYEERLLANKERYKAGEVSVGKHVESKTQRVSVPVEKEKVVVERTTPTDTKAVTPGTADFKEGEVARMDVYEEKANIGKEAFVREQVNVKKVTEQDTVTAEEQIRREELDMDTKGRPTIDRNDRSDRKR